MSDTFLYLTTTGRSSGQPRRIEIWFVDHDGCHYVVAERKHEAQWVKNLVADAKVSFSVGTGANPTAVLTETPALARPLEPVRDAERIRTVKALMTAKYGWSDGLVVEIR